VVVVVVTCSSLLLARVLTQQLMPAVARVAASSKPCATSSELTDLVRARIPCMIPRNSWEFLGFPFRFLATKGRGKKVFRSKAVLDSIGQSNGVSAAGKKTGCLSSVAPSFVPSLSVIEGGGQVYAASFAPAPSGCASSPSAQSFFPVPTEYTIRLERGQSNLTPLSPTFSPQSVPQALSPMAQEYSPHASAFLKPKTPTCRFFLRGACRKGLECPFVHDTSMATSVNREFKEELAFPSPFFVEEGISCEFGSGASIEKFILGQGEATDGSSSIAISGLPGFISERDIERCLSCFGELCHVSLQSSSQPTTTSFAIATFKEPAMAKEAATVLHGSTTKSWKSHSASQHSQSSGVGMNSVSVTVKKSCASMSGVSVKVQWYAASRSGRAYFGSRSLAQKAVSLCNGKDFDGRQLSVKYEMPGYFHQHSFSVWIGNLRESAQESRLKSFIERHARCKVQSVSITPIHFTERMGPTIVQKLLKLHGGPLVSFEASSQYDNGLKRKALARFANSSDAQKACKYFQMHQKINDLGGSRLFLQRIFTVKYTFPANVLNGIQAEVDAVLRENPTARYRMFENSLTKSLSVQADEEGILVSIKSRLDPIMKGEIVRDPKQGCRMLWNRYIASTRFPEDIQKGGLSSYIWCNKRRQEVRVFGSNEQRRKTIEQVLTYCEESAIDTHAVPISRFEFDHILQNGRGIIDRVMRAAACRKVSLDLKHRSLLVEGSTADAKKVAMLVSKVVNGKAEKEAIDSAALCPVCFCPPDEDSHFDSSIVVQLSCMHAYCGECFETWLTADNMCEFPLVCLAETCSTPVALRDLQKYLHGQSLPGLLRSSVDNHVRENPSVYQFCVSPACPGIYEVIEGKLLATCSTCSLNICTECNVSHEGLSCDEYKEASLPPDRVRMKIVEEILTLRCPRCSIAFLDFTGCFALSCNICPCRFCGWCLKDCGSDAHPHVAVCPHKENGADKYFGTEQQFIEAQKKQRHKKLLIFLDTLQPGERESVLKSIEADLRDLGIHA